MATTSNQFTDTPYPWPPHWDVFLSFYDPETRGNFISDLYSALHLAGIRIFRKDLALLEGEEISSHDAIRHSTKFVVVISKNYSSSTWCLDELVEILSNRERKQIIPVFYCVDPSDMRYQKRSFVEAFDYNHRYDSPPTHKPLFVEAFDYNHRYDSPPTHKPPSYKPPPTQKPPSYKPPSDITDKWRSALSQIAELPGYHLKGHENESEARDIIVDIVDKVLYKTNPKTHWDVFLSFCGEDTRYKFTSHLYCALDRHGVRTFRDDSDLHTGEVISDSLLEAIIQESKIYIVVFSENYASSTWCLDKLVQILQCCKSLGILVVPIFYNIEKSVVHDQTGNFNEAFEKHTTSFHKDRMAKWRATLMDMANLAGYSVCKNMPEADIINKVVDRVLLEINPMTLYVAKYPVGLDSRVREITALLNSKTEGITRIGIHGMGGVGKTTLAKAVYNRNYHHFQGSCFLANVREELQKESGLVSLQQKLVRDVLKCKNINIDNFYHGIALIRDKICSRKALIVIDDLESPTVLEFLIGPFAFGSKIIITTRNEDLLDLIKVEDRYRYKVNELGNAESRQLLSQHAFDKNEIPKKFRKLSQKVLKRARGLPLAIEVFGSNFKQMKEGVTSINQLEQFSSSDRVEKELRISFDALRLVDPMLQDIFLDIACFFIGWMKEEVIRIMETCYTFVCDNIDILKKRCLLTINDKDELQMHDLLQDMGRKIACNDCPDEPVKHSRLWAPKDINDVLKNHKETEAIEGIIPSNFNYQDAYGGASYSTETFKRMSKLRFLFLKKINLTGSFEQTFEDLRWLFWDYCPLKSIPSEFYPEELVILELPHSKMTTIWELNSVDSRVFKNLKTLNMSYSLELTTTADFTKLPFLETLNLEGCKSLEEVSISIGSLKRLLSLNLQGCVKLRNIPDSTCNLRALKSLNVGGCRGLKTLPSKLGDIESLTELIVWGLDVPKLPDSIRQHSKLVVLNLSDNQYIETPSSSASNSTPTSWDTFLSFTGRDTGLGFSNHLHSALVCHGVRTFMDSPELRSGEVISDRVIQAIKKSKTYIVVLTENYASSSWCLDELVEILNCNQTMDRLVIPVFYNIKPCIVRHETGIFKEAFEKHISRFVGEMEKDENWDERIKDRLERIKNWRERVKGWRRSLRKVANSSGREIDGNRSVAVIVKEIVDEILLKINPTALHVATYPVGLESRVKDITSLLSIDTEGVIKIGIYGMGGVGKTTLAKALYNQLLGGRSFKGSCFLENVKENSGKSKGLEPLQQQLLTDVLKSKDKIKVSSVDQGIEMIKDRICSKKILVVIDDLGNKDQFESLVGTFASGSVVIITTRNEETLHTVGVKPKYLYLLKEWDDDQSMELFTKYAFEKVEPPNNLLALSKVIVGLANGLPLALKVFGSYLYMKSEGRWKHYIKNLQEVPNGDIQKRLIISLDDLEPDDKNIFLDIACLFIGWAKERVVEILNTYYSSADENIDILKKRCLLTINNRDELRMHDLIRDIGREIARNSFRHEPGGHSRLWVSKTISDVLTKNKGTEAIEGIVPQELYYQDKVDSTEKSFKTETFKGMSKLRFLYLWNVNLTGSFEQTFEDLRWFGWEGCPLKCLPSEFYPQKLVTLELPHSNMTTIWENNLVPHVFEKLKTLNMMYSEFLTTTPDFAKLPCLERLNLAGCKSLEEVHISIGSLVKLQCLYLQGCVKLRSLPDTICNLRSLEILNVGFCSNLEALPMAIGNIESLKEIDAGSLTVSRLPDSFGSLTKLVKLDLSHNKKLETLSDTIFNLRSLEVLSIEECRQLKRFPDQLWKLTRLRELNACGAYMLKKLPDIEPSHIVLSLQQLDLSRSGITALPSGISQLLNLQSLDLSRCYSLLSIPKLPPNLKVIRAHDCSSLERLPDLSNLKQLEKLDLKDCTVPYIQGLEALISIRILRLRGFMKLTEIKGLEELTALSELDLTYCMGLIYIQGLETLISIRILRLRGCMKLTEIKGLEELTALSELDLTYCTGLTYIQGLEALVSIKILRLRGCMQLTEIKGLEGLTALSELDLTDCTGLTYIQGLETLVSIRILRLQGCVKLTEIKGLEELTTLSELDLTCCTGLTYIQGLEALVSIRILRLGGCMKLTKIKGLEELTALNELDLTSCMGLTYIQGLEALISIRILRLGFTRMEFTKRLCQVYSEFGHEISVYGEIQNSESHLDWISESPYWTGQSSSNLYSTLYAHLLPNESHNFMGLILCFERGKNARWTTFGYSVKNTTSGFIWRRTHGFSGSSNLIVIVPKSIFSVSDDDHMIEFTADNYQKNIGIHLLYKTETNTIEDKPCVGMSPPLRRTETPATTACPSPSETMSSATISQTPSSYPSSAIPTRWDVFLSFRGSDTRYNITSHLYSALNRHGIRVFMDDPELRSRELISDALIQAIQESKTYIVVFSENYASSPWCLNELVKILNCHKTGERLVIPVFYKIYPSVVRNQIGSFQRAFEKHYGRFEIEKVNEWRSTLTQVAQLSGLHICENRHEADIINQIVDEILPKITDIF